MIAHTHEFKFNIAAFHHAHEAWLVPDLLKQTYGGTPAVAMFSANGNYKLEAYFGTPFAGPILQSHNITPIFKSDHPVTDSRRVLNQASQAHHFGLDEASSLRSVITAPAQALGLGHRIGFLNKGYDADVVLWNDHPLALVSTDPFLTCLHYRLSSTSHPLPDPNLLSQPLGCHPSQRHRRRSQSTQASLCSNKSLHQEQRPRSSSSQISKLHLRD